MTKYNSIDLLKFIASFFVIIIHVSLFSEFSPFLNLFIAHGISRLAVPLYFLVSAFFYNKKNIILDETQQKKSLKRYINRMAVLYLGWFVISLPKTIYERFIYNGKPLIINLFQFVKSFFLTSTFSGSWFLLSCVFSVILLYVFYNMKLVENVRADKIMLIISIACYVFCVVTSAYGNLFDKIGFKDIYSNMIYYTAKPYTSIIVGVPYFFLGRYIAKNDIHLNTISKIAGTFCIILFFFEVFITSNLNLQKSSDCYFMLLPSAYFIFILLKDVKIEFKFNPIFLRNSSTIIFFSHFIYIFILEIFEVVFSMSFNSLYRFIIVSILSLITSAVFLILSRFKIFNWLKYLY